MKKWNWDDIWASVFWIGVLLIIAAFVLKDFFLPSAILVVSGVMFFFIGVIGYYRREF